MMDRGYLTLMRVRGVPLRLHWTLPLGALLLSGGRFEPGLWLGIVLVIALHEAGHALVVHRVGLVNLGVDLTGFGGRCVWAGHPTPIQRALVAWGGVLAQLALLVPMIAVSLLVDLPARGFLADLVEAFTRANAFLIVVNLLPIQPLDGAEAWPLLRHLWDARRRRRAWQAKVAPKKPQTLRDAFEEAERERKRRSG